MATDDGRDRLETEVDVEAETRLGGDAPRPAPASTDAEAPASDADSNAATRVGGDDAEQPPEDASTRVADVEPAHVDEDAATRVAGAGEPAEPDDDPDAEAATRVSAKRPIAPASNAPAEPASRPGGVALGEVLFGEYEVLEVLGAGGMGEVYKCLHRRLEEPRAIKMMHADLSNKKGANEFFLREAKALLAVRHSAVVHCHDLLSDDQGRVYLIMELIEGVALSERLKDGPLPADEVIVLGARLAAGLAAAHRCGVVHRDVSPDNVVLPDGDVSRAKLIDFGIAKLLDEGQGTIVDGFKGKLGYASPEQLGFFGGEIDGRSDFYSLGLVLCAASLGRPMGMGTTVMEAVDARRHLGHVPDEIPIGLRSAIEPLLALDPKDRPHRVEQLFVSPGQAAALGDDLPAAPVARRRAAVEPAPAAGSSGAIRWASVAAGLALLLGIGGYLLMGGGESATVPTRAAPPAAPGEPRTVSPPGQEPVTVRARPAPPTKPEPDTTPAKPAVKQVSALDKVRIVGLLRGADAALAENRLQSPKGDNAFEKYSEVLRIDPGNREAKQGLLNVATRYLGLSEQALRADDIDKAKTYLSKASAIAPHHPKLGEVREAVNSAGG
jgi:serine/threonine-protein kinase